MSRITIQVAILIVTHHTSILISAAATLPHEKYYNMEAYERRMSALRQGEYLPPVNDSYDFNADMKAVSSSHKKKLTEQDTYMSKEQLQELRRVQQERSEVSRYIPIFHIYSTHFSQFRSGG